VLWFLVLVVVVVVVLPDPFREMRCGKLHGDISVWPYPKVWGEVKDGGSRAKNLRQRRRGSDI